jgi:hypothetical protein
MKINNWNKSIGVLSMIFTAFGASNFERIDASFVKTNK